MIKKILPFLLLIGFLVGCSKDDGDWEAMKWKADTDMKEEKGSYVIDAEGATITFTCKNYSSPWIEGARVGNNYIEPNRNSNDYKTLRGDWFSATITGNQLEVVVSRNTTQLARAFLLSVTAGDIFHTFQFVQKAP